jgi:hypothetical protein
VNSWHAVDAKIARNPAISGDFAFADASTYTSKYNANSYGCGLMLTGSISFSRL